MKWTAATVIALSIGAVGLALESAVLFLSPLFVLLGIGLIQEWVSAKANQNKSENVEEIPSE